MGQSTAQRLTLFGVRSDWGSKVMGKNDSWDYKFVLNFLTGSRRGRPLGNVVVDLLDLPLKYGADTTSRSEVIEFTVNDFFCGKVGQLTASFPTSCCFSNWQVWSNIIKLYKNKNKYQTWTDAIYCCIRCVHCTVLYTTELNTYALMRRQYSLINSSLFVFTLRSRILRKHDFYLWGAVVYV